MNEQDNSRLVMGRDNIAQNTSYFPHQSQHLRYGFLTLMLVLVRSHPTIPIAREQRLAKAGLSVTTNRNIRRTLGFAHAGGWPCDLNGRGWRDDVEIRVAEGGFVGNDERPSIRSLLIQSLDAIFCERFNSSLPPLLRQSLQGDSVAGPDRDPLLTPYV